jgi:poly(glycerol-phosphate) alpha-glucosyltransferase
MKVAFLTSSVSRQAGGLQDGVRLLAQSVRAIGTNELHVLSMRDEFTDSDLPLWSPLPTSAFKVLGPRYFGFAPELKRALFDLDADIVHVHGLWMFPSVAAGSWHKRTRRPLVVSPHGMLDPWAIKNSYWKKRVAGFLYENNYLQHASCIRALCRAEADAIRAYGLKNPIAIIPNGIHRPTQVTNLVPPWSHKIKPDAKVLLYLGRLHPKKGLLNLLRAWKSIGKESADWVLVIAGWDQGGHENELKKFVAANELEESIVFAGPLFGETKASAFQNANAFILPSFSEGLPIVVLEAWSNRLPVLMTPQCNIPEAFPGGAALRIEPDSESIARGLCAIFRMSHTEGQLMAEQGLNLISQRFTWSKVARDLHTVCEWLLEGGPVPENVMTN